METYFESIRSLSRSHDGRPKSLVGEVLDITKGKRAQEALSTVNRRRIEAQQERKRIGPDLHRNFKSGISVAGSRSHSKRCFEAPDPAMPGGIMQRSGLISMREDVRMVNGTFAVVIRNQSGEPLYHLCITGVRARFEMRCVLVKPVQ